MTSIKSIRFPYLTLRPILTSSRTKEGDPAMLTIGLRLPLGSGEVGAGRVLAALVAHWRRMADLRAARRVISEMDERMLSDIGVSRAQALFEIDREMHWR
jgi:uncharacterized protein YjiS (DUF1127 family)